MKKQLFTFFISLWTAAVFAQQNPIAVKGATTDLLASTLDEAIELAHPNDKIYLPGGTFTLNDSIQKPIHIIGTGYDHTIPRATPITVFSSSINIGSQAMGTIIEGVRINGDINVMADYVTLRNIYGGAVRIKPEMEQTTIIRAVAYGISNSNYGASTLNATNVNVYNSIIMGSFTRVSNSYVRNSITSYPNNVGGCSFIYCSNIIVENSICAGDNWYGIAYSSDNISLVNSLTSWDFVNFPPTSNQSPPNFFNSDFHLSPTAPIQDIGVYYGDYPWKDGGQPINPHIEQNNSFLDVQNEQFKLKVKVVPQTN
ncbi:MAG: hypothetical protein BGO40_12170 [Chryseobacterium sp. 39-10]|nr:hypothetical protein [Chryseobacterium sp.]OJV46728.1 MAG: hypothetical protein BGO40_12170 [Chryseobacterium sp. 39-10]